MNKFGATIGLPNSACLAGWCSLPIVVAQGCCWCGVITDNKIWHVAEESLWGAAFAMHCFLATFGWLHAIRPGQSKQVEAAASAADPWDEEGVAAVPMTAAPRRGRSAVGLASVAQAAVGGTA